MTGGPAKRKCVECGEECWGRRCSACYKRDSKKTLSAWRSRKMRKSRSRVG